MIKIEFITNWTQGIIVAVIIGTIIEMILPNSSNSKYVKTVIGIFVLFTIISPIINKLGKGFGHEINLDSYDNQTIQTNAHIDLNNKDTILKIYEENLKVDIKAKITQKGYVVGEINLDILNNIEYTLNKINIKILAKNEEVYNQTNSNVTTIVENIENIKIDLGGSSNSNTNEKSVISESEKRKLKQYLSSVYEVNETNIIIN